MGVGMGMGMGMGMRTSHFRSCMPRSAGPSLALLYRRSALAGGEGWGRRMDGPLDEHVHLRNPETREVFNLRLRRGYLFRCTLEPSRFGDRPPLTLAGLHLQVTSCWHHPPQP